MGGYRPERYRRHRPALGSSSKRQGIPQLVAARGFARHSGRVPIKRSDGTPWPPGVMTRTSGQGR